MKQVHDGPGARRKPSTRVGKSYAVDRAMVAWVQEFAERSNQSESEIVNTALENLMDDYAMMAAAGLTVERIQKLKYLCLVLRRGGRKALQKEVQHE